jgi:hypothetical protein
MKVPSFAIAAMANSILMASPGVIGAQHPAAGKPVGAHGPEKKNVAQASIPESKPFDVSGNWTWSLTPVTRAGNVGNEYTFAVQLIQSGEDVKGSFDCSNCARPVQNAPIKGTFKNGQLKLAREDLAFSGFELIPTKDGRLTGTYTGRGNVRYEIDGKRK